MLEPESSYSHRYDDAKKGCNPVSGKEAVGAFDLLIMLGALLLIVTKHFAYIEVDSCLLICNSFRRR
jgi:hypothetical protein